jgi:hypothetical protein
MPPPPPARPAFTSIQAALGNTRNITTFVTALYASGLQTTLLQYKGTVFIPTDTAFTATLRSLNLQIGQVLTNPTLLKSILQYHVTPTVFATPAALAAATQFTTLSSKSIAVSTECALLAHLRRCRPCAADACGCGSGTLLLLSLPQGLLGLHSPRAALAILISCPLSPCLPAALQRLRPPHPDR